MTRRINQHSRNVWKILTDGKAERSVTLRHYAFKMLGRVSPAVVNSYGRHRYLLSTSDQAVSRETYIHGNYELDIARSSVDLLGRILGREPVAGRVFIDVGANIGTTAIPAIIDWGASSVLAIEPSPENFKLLRCNAILNNCFDRMKFEAAAISTSVGQVELALSPQNSGDNRVLHEGGRRDKEFAEEARKSVTVPSLPLDVAIDKHGVRMEEVGLIWVDTQGHETQVLQSATRALASNIPVIAEYWPYGLQQSTGVDEFHQLVAEKFTTVVDARTGVEVAPRELDALHQRYSAPRAFTDLILLA